MAGAIAGKIIMNMPEKAEKLIHYIDEQLLSGNYLPSSRIPSIRNFAKRFNISYGSAMNAINYLCEQGKLSKIANKGIYVCNKPNYFFGNSEKCGLKIGFLIGNDNSTDYQSLWYSAFYGLCHAAESDGNSIELVHLPIKNCQNLLNEKIMQYDGVILFNSCYWQLDYFPNKMPAIGAFFDTTLKGTLSVINIDPIDSAQKATAYFKERGIKHINIFSSIQKVFMLRAHIFAALWSEAGGTFTINNELLHTYNTNESYFFTSDTFCQDAHVLASNNDGVLPNECKALLSIDGKRILHADYYNFSTIGVNWCNLGRTLYDEIIFQKNTPSIPIRNINITGEILLNEGQIKKN